MMPFTRGPWKAVRNQSFSYTINTHDVRGRGYDCNVVREVRCEANAFLIAAAPDMYAALEKIATTVHHVLLDGKGMHSADCPACVAEVALLKAKEGR